MVVKQAARLLKGVGDPTRLRILQLLLKGDAYCGQIARELDAPYARVNRHLRYLEKSGLVVQREQHDPEVYYALRPADDRFHKALLALLAAEAPRLSAH